MAASATALFGLTKHYDAISTRSLVLHLHDFLKDWVQVIRQLPYGIGDAESAIVPKAIFIICISLHLLTSLLPLDREHGLHELIRCLRVICFGPRHSYHKEASNELEAFIQAVVLRGRREAPGSEGLRLLDAEVEALRLDMINRAMMEGGKSWMSPLPYDVSGMSGSMM